MTEKDWIAEAAAEVAAVAVSQRWHTVEDLRTIIAKHVPFKPDVAYMSVPRCESCAHWMTLHGVDGGRCAGDTLTGEWTKSDFGCVEWKEKP